MTGWRWTWAAAQVTGVLFSSVIWILVIAIPVPVAPALLVIGVAVVLSRGTRFGLWRRFGVRPAKPFERARVGAAIVPIASLRGRRQPNIWVGRRMAGRDVVMATDHDLVVSEQLVGRVVMGELGEDEASAIVSYALGQQRVDTAALVASVDAYCTPWRIVAQVIGGFNAVASRTRLLPIAWKARWIVFGVAIVDSYLNQRWAALVMVAIIAGLSWSTSFFADRWARTQQRIGDARVIAEGFGPTLASMIRGASKDIADQERAAALSQGGSA